MFINLERERKSCIFQYNFFINFFLININDAINNVNINSYYSYIKNNIYMDFFNIYLNFKLKFLEKFKQNLYLKDFFILISLEYERFNFFTSLKLKICNQNFNLFILNLLNKLVEFNFIKVFEYINMLYFYIIKNEGYNYKQKLIKLKNTLFIDFNNIYIKDFFLRLRIIVCTTYINFTPYLKSFFGELLELLDCLSAIKNTVDNNIFQYSFNDFLNIYPFSNLSFFRHDFWYSLIMHKYPSYHELCRLAILVRQFLRKSSKLNNIFFKKIKKLFKTRRIRKYMKRLNKSFKKVCLQFVKQKFMIKNIKYIQNLKISLEVNSLDYRVFDSSIIIKNLSLNLQFVKIDLDYSLTFRDLEKKNLEYLK